KNGVLVESLIDGKRIPAFSNERISSLEEISIFTETDDVPLKDVFRTMFKSSNEQQVLSHKSENNELIAFFKTILPNYDSERVYVSDIKKTVQWYNLLQSKGLIDLIEDPKDEEIEEAEIIEENE
ncbi:MAG: DUF5606 domain-containing protein, partial [Bacteroidota bacterium]